MTVAVMPGGATAAEQPSTLKAMVKDFLTMALMIRRGNKVVDVQRLRAGVDEFFPALERDARRANYSVEQVKDVQYALCAFLDESVLNAGPSEIRNQIEINPLQFQYFGVHLAGQGFFDKLEALRTDVKRNLDVLEVYHLCLALGFEGKYSLEQKDQLRYIANTLGQDIARHHPPRKALAPQWALPDQVSQMLRYEVPLWLYLVLVALVCGAVYLTLDWLLGKEVAALAEQVRRLFGV
ncbi:type IVB secretion system protein IcmH/DotU [Pseudomonas sp. NPDC089422]|uniref:type IVB secretion system protein IcmH/DotU n=1 Tax=Pseudomonas sp. NPDC089422 TaxID=3364466 RepID=UPI0038044DF6